MLWIRLNSSPYLPDIEDENREEKGSVINYYEAKSVWYTLVNETSTEHGLTEDSFKELDAIWDQFLEDSSMKKNPYKIPASVMAKTPLKDARKESDADLRKSKKSYSVKSYDDKNINLGNFQTLSLRKF